MRCWDATKAPSKNSGDALAETDGSGNTLNEYVFFAGRRVASRNGSGAIFYYFADQVGSTRIITTGSGPSQTPGQLCYDADFTPYGQEMSHSERLQTTACPPNYKFTGYERDTETGLDYAFARYYSSRLGRFLSTDPLGGSIGDLQSHNAYAYVRNNPPALVDPTGMYVTGPGQCSLPAGDPCSGGGGGGDTSCSIDGLSASCGTVITLINMGGSGLAPAGPGSFWVWTPPGSVTTSASETNPDGSVTTQVDDTTDYPGYWSLYTLGPSISVDSQQAGLNALKQSGNMAGVVINGKGIVGFYLLSAGAYLVVDYVGGGAVAETADAAFAPVFTAYYTNATVQFVVDFTWSAAVVPAAPRPNSVAGWLGRYAGWLWSQSGNW